MKIPRRVVLSAAERIQQLPTPFLSELEGLRRNLERRGKSIVDLGRYSLTVPPEATDPGSSSDPATIKPVLADYLHREYQADIDPNEEILLVSGMRPALLLIAAQFVDAGTICHIPDPGFDGYRKMVQLFDGKPRLCPLHQRNDYLANLEQLNSTASKAPSVFFITSPNNPTGAVADENFYARLYRMASEANVLVIVDSSYALSYSGNFRPPLFCQARQRSKVGLELISLSTTLAAPQLKLAAIIGRKRMLEPLATIGRSLGLLPSTPLLNYAASFFASTDAFSSHINRCRDEIGKRVAVITESLQAAGIEFYPSTGAGFVWVKLRHGRLSVGFARALLRRREVLVAPGVAFGEEGEGWVRIAANLEPDRLREAMSHFVRAYQPIKSRLQRRAD